MGNAEYMGKMSDKEATGSLNEEEFKTSIMCWQAYLDMFAEDDSYGTVMFRKFDTDGSGALNREQLRAYLQEMNGGETVTDEDVNYVLANADVMGDGQIAKIELCEATSVWWMKME